MPIEIDPSGSEDFSLIAELVAVLGWCRRFELEEDVHTAYYLSVIVNDFKREPLT